VLECIYYIFIYYCSLDTNGDVSPENDIATMSAAVLGTNNTALSRLKSYKGKAINPITGLDRP
jgi:hypothetical protein